MGAAFAGRGVGALPVKGQVVGTVGVGGAGERVADLGVAAIGRQAAAREVGLHLGGLGRTGAVAVPGPGLVPVGHGDVVGLGEGELDSAALAAITGLDGVGPCGARLDAPLGGEGDFRLVGGRALPGGGAVLRHVAVARPYAVGEGVIPGLEGDGLARLGGGSGDGADTQRVSQGGDVRGEGDLLLVAHAPLPGNGFPDGDLRRDVLVDAAVVGGRGGGCHPAAPGIGGDMVLARGRVAREGGCHLASRRSDGQVGLGHVGLEIQRTGPGDGVPEDRLVGNDGDALGRRNLVRGLHRQLDGPVCVAAHVEVRRAVVTEVDPVEEGHLVAGGVGRPDAEVDVGAEVEP